MDPRLEDSRSLRRYTRHERSLEVRFWKRGDPTPMSGSATDISAGGMSLLSEARLAAGTRLEIRFLDAASGFVVEGEITNNKESGMGVRFLQVKELVAALVVPEPPPPELVESAEIDLAEFGIFRIKYGSQAEFRQAYERDLMSGGLFVPSTRPAVLGADVQLDIVVEDAGLDPVRLGGRVVQQATGGMGVEIVNLQSAQAALMRLGGFPGQGPRTAPWPT